MARFAAAALVRAVAMVGTLFLVMIVLVRVAMGVLVVGCPVVVVIVIVVAVVIPVPVIVDPALGINRAAAISASISAPVAAAAVSRPAWHFHTRYQPKSQRSKTQEAKTVDFHNDITSGWKNGIKRYRVP
jgi:hypothetical protein